MSDDPTALAAALMEIERFVRHSGWDQPARLFALVETDIIVSSDPALAERLGLRGTADGAPEGALTSIEQDDFHAGEDLAETLAKIAWPVSVAGCALVVERSFLPSSAEDDVPDDPVAAADFVARHPERDDIRVVAGAMRSPACQHALVRLRTSQDLLVGEQLAPALTEALAQTLAVTVEEAP